MPLVTLTVRSPKSGAFKSAVLDGVHAALVAFNGLSLLLLLQRPYLYKETAATSTNRIVVADIATGHGRLCMEMLLLLRLQGWLVSCIHLPLILLAKKEQGKCQLFGCH